jgi:hypothetical protein
MNVKHFTDDEIQLLAFEPDRITSEFQDHLNSCPSCSARLKFYREHFSSLQFMPKPFFDFDLSAAVTQQIREKRRIPVNVFRVVCFLAIATASSFIAHWLFTTYLHEFFTNFSYVLIFLMLAAILSFLCFQLWDTWRKYQKKIDALNLF